IQATKAVRRVSPRVRVVMVTASASPQCRQWAREAGAVRYVTKDTPARDLLDTVVEVAAGAPSLFSPSPGRETATLGRTACALPSVVRDAMHDPRTADLPITRDADIGAYVGVPVRLWDGSLYGTLCCLSHDPEPTLNARDIRFMRALAEIVAEQLDQRELQTEK